MPNKTVLSIAAGLLGLVLACDAARAGVFVITEFQGTPRNAAVNSTKQMPLWESGIVYLYSDGGPILSAEFSGTSPGGYIRGIFGRMGQRWESSRGNSFYDTASPGPLNIVNAQSDLSLDSHFLGVNGQDRVFTSEPNEGNVLFPGVNPLPSTSSTGYGVGAVSTVSYEEEGFLRASFSVKPGFESNYFPMAYLVLGDGMTFSGDVTTTDGTFRIAHFLINGGFPEPAGLLSGLAPILVLSCRIRNRPRRLAEHAEG